MFYFCQKYNMKKNYFIKETQNLILNVQIKYQKINIDILIHNNYSLFVATLNMFL